MSNIEKIDNELYKAIYIKPRIGEYKKIWKRIRDNKDILREAVEVKKDKFNQYDITKGITISEQILRDYKNVDEVAYNNLINTIYTNVDIARLVVDGYANGGYSYLLMSLWNHELKLTEEQKAFAVDEAMNKIGTTRYKEYYDSLSKKLDEMGISDKNTAIIEFSGLKNPIGQKTGSIYMNGLFSSLDRTQAHGIGDYDIRYYILRNPNWTIEEKQKLITEFWYDMDDFDECLEQWEWEIVNNDENYKYNELYFFDISHLYDYTYEDLLKFFGNKKTTNRIWDEILFCKQMHGLREKQKKLESTSQVKVLKPINN